MSQRNPQTVPDAGMTPGERRATAAVALVFGLRMAGLFMILPVFALYAGHLEGVTPTLVGVAIGAYGLTQALLQIPFGLLSDRLGRKRVITAGLVVFAAGSVVAATADGIWGVILGRALQGAGAVAAALMALLADLTRDEQRTKAMAGVGMSIGLSFALAMVAGPPLAAWIGVPGIFWLTGVLALLGIAVIHGVVPDPARSSRHRDTEPVPGELVRVLAQPELLRLDLGIFALHAVLTATFVALPPLLRSEAGLAPAAHGWLYLGAMAAGVAGMVPLVILAERRGRMRAVFLGAIVLLALAELLLWAGHGRLVPAALALAVFFWGFNVLEATLPSLVSRTVRPDGKGTAMGVYSSSQFLGAFVGGALGGWVSGRFGLPAVFLAALGLLVLWLAAALGMRPPPARRSVLVPVGRLEADEAALLATRLAALPGVVEAVVVAEEELAYLKVDPARFDPASVREFSVAAA
ncbi:MFS transporter [Inmirania thermothiophila]|uniref:Putative MFS family arabinose efflux permease n=1 Tax=Inmirania thermothiophila TaxID=1750597 RepID=A0A3N1Y7S6_9GAMM|nr:MFS transporter [Inmirania thermothiophila]ROR34853.1 putative MFS family arabinose efflux permease [Inmirania thermothiophila]